MTMQLVDASVLVDHPQRTAVVIGHRGASGYRPEHTLAAYELAIRLGADAIEPDLVTTSDGVLVARHENEIGGTTDVASRAEFAGRRTTKVVDGRRLTGWFTEDFTLAELKTLRASERLGDVRPANKLYDGRWEIATLDEILALVAGESRRAGRQVGLVLELKHSTYFAHLGLDLEPRLLETLERHGVTGSGEGVVVESFETTNLVWLSQRCDLPLVQLVEETGQPADLVGTTTTYADLLTPQGLARVATYAVGVSVHKDLVLPRDADGRIGAASSLVGDAHALGLLVMVWTLRAENQFLPADFRIGSEPASHGDLAGEVRAHLEAGVDGVFTDFPDLAVQVEPGPQSRSALRWGTSTHATR